MAVLTSAVSAFALDPKKAVTQFSLDIWEADEGLPESSVQAITQTRDGYLWIGTQEGLVRFDGVRFKVFDRKSGLLASNFVQVLVETRDGSLWIGTGGGGLTRLLGGVSTTFRKADGLTSDVIWSLFEDREGSLWIGTAGGGLMRHRDGGFKVFGAAEGLSGGRVLTITEDRTDTLWVGTDGGGVYRRVGNRFERVPGEGPSYDTVYALHVAQDGTLWVGTEGGLLRISDGRFVDASRGWAARQRIGALEEDRDGSLWLGTEGGGLYRFRDGRFEAFTSQEGLSSDIVRALFEDREGSLWVGTRGGGLNRLKDGRITTYGRREGLSSDIVWSILEGRDGSLWVATDGGGLDRLHDGRVTAYTTRDGLAHNQVRALAEDRNGDLWVGTWGGGLSLFRNGRFVATHKKKEGGLSHDFIRALHVDHRGALWIGTFGGGLVRLEGGRFTVFTTADGLANDTIYWVHEDRGGVLWIGTRGGGLSRLEDGRFQTFTRRDGLPDDVVLSLHEDALGALWIGTTGGIARYKDGRFAAVTSRDGLFDDVAYRILEDDAGTLWMSSNRGIYRLAKQDFEDFAAGRSRTVSSIGYGRADGMKSAECNGGVQPAGWKTRDGRLWFPTIRGLAMLEPRTMVASTSMPPVVIEEVLNDRRPVGSATASPRLPPGKGEFEFHYTALTFIAPERVRFRYRLEGFDPDWVEAGSRRAAFYTNLPPGSYRFRVTTSNENGVWDAQGASFAFYLAPPFYRTAWFRALGATGLVLFGASLYGLRVRSLRVRQRDLMRLVDERTHDLREAIRLKDEVVSIVAHDFRSPLTLIHGYAELLIGKASDEETRNALLTILSNSNRLASLAEDTLTMSRIETGDFPITRAPLDLARLVREMVASRDGRDGVRVEAPAPVVVQGDERRLYQVVENLIGNAVKYSGAAPLVQVSVRIAAEGAHLSVKDEGPGIAPEEIPRLFQRFSRLDGARRSNLPGTGLGLYICRSIVEAHGGRIWAESAPGQGSTFHVVLPL